MGEAICACISVAMALISWGFWIAAARHCRSSAAKVKELRLQIEEMNREWEAESAKILALLFHPDNQRS